MSDTLGGKTSPSSLLLEHFSLICLRVAAYLWLRLFFFQCLIGKHGAHFLAFDVLHILALNFLFRLIVG